MRVNLRRAIGLGALLSIAVACSDGILPTSPGDAPGASHPPKVTADFLIDVDLTTGDAVVRPLGSSGALTDGVIAGRFYGTSSQIAYRFFDLEPAEELPDGRKLFTMPVRIENLLAHRVGTLQETGTVVSAPGIYVYVSVLPFVTVGCAPMTPGCSGSVHEPDGVGSFSALNQPYWYFGEYLEPTDGVANSGPDLSSPRAFRFIAGGDVQNMTFGVSVKAPWALPGESYTINWNSTWDPMTGGAGPLWTVQGSGTPTIVTDPSLCGGEPPCLRFSTTSGSRLQLYRADPLSTSQSAFMEGTALSIQLSNGNNPTGLLGMWDGVKFMQVGMSGTHIGFTNLASSALIEKVQQHLPTQPTTLRLVKDATSGMVSLYMNGVLRVSLAYTAFPDYTPTGDGPHPTIWFGNHGGGTSGWSNVSYGIGTTSP